MCWSPDLGLTWYVDFLWLHGSPEDLTLSLDPKNTTKKSGSSYQRKHSSHLDPSTFPHPPPTPTPDTESECSTRSAVQCRLWDWQKHGGATGRCFLFRPPPESSQMNLVPSCQSWCHSRGSSAVRFTVVQCISAVVQLQFSVALM